MAQVSYDVLEVMGYLSQMNAGNLEKVIMGLPEWILAKFAERLKRLESEGPWCQPLKDVVVFLKEWALV